MTMHEDWTDKLSDYLDGELDAGERSAVEAHLRECHACAAVLSDLTRVVAQAESVTARPPEHDLWPGIASRLGTEAGERRGSGGVRLVPRRYSFTLPQLAAAAVLLLAIAGAAAWRLAPRPEQPRASAGVDAAALRAPQPSTSVESPAERSALPVSLADDQYDAAVADLERALRQGRGRLDAQTIAIVEHNLQIIDQAIAQAREALATDPANTYLSGHLVEARRRKLDLLRRATALTDTN
jgi:anti-sigma factor RsiW